MLLKIVKGFEEISANEIKNRNNFKIDFILQIYNEYLFIKSLVDHTNKYIGPRIFALFFSLIPFCSYFLSSFTELAESRLDILIFFLFWATTIWSTFFLAADTSLQARKPFVQSINILVLNVGTLFIRTYFLDWRNKTDINHKKTTTGKIM